MIVWASIDESHDQKQADAYAVAALIGTGDDWFEFQRSWDRTLRLNDMTYFKTNEYKKRNGEFAKFKSELEGAQLAQIVWDDFAQIVRTSHLVGIVLGINLRDYHRVRAKPKMARILPANPYRYAYQTTFVRTAMLMAEELETSPRVSFLCDEHSQAKNLAASMPSLRKANPHASAYIGSLSFGVDEKEPALQAADLLAGVSKNYFVRRVQGSEAKDDLSCLSAKLGRQVGIGYVDEAVFEKLAAGNILKNGRPSIYSSVQEKLFRD